MRDGRVLPAWASFSDSSGFSGIEMKESLQGFLFWIFRIFFYIRERWEESFRDSFSGFSGFSFL